MLYNLFVVEIDLLIFFNRIYHFYIAASKIFIYYHV